MKNAIRILLYLLLALLVVAISVIIYKRSKAPVDDVPTSSEMADSLFMDQAQTNQKALNSEDSMILDLTGQLPTEVGAPASSSVSKPENKNNNTGKSGTPDSNIDYSEPIGPSEPSAAINTNPRAQKSIEQPAHTKPVSQVVSKVETKKADTKIATSAAPKKTEVKNTPSKTASKPAAQGNGFYVVSGSFIVPSHADEQVKKLKTMGYKAANRKVFGSSEYYSAVVGTYSNRIEAEKVMNKLLSKGEKAFLKAK